jgi:sodium/potassium-transporting ATPase subunit alpha
MASITDMLLDHCLALRDGLQMSVVALNIVLGDVLFIKEGNKLPADVRFVEVSSNAKFDRLILTGNCALRELTYADYVQGKLLPYLSTVENTDENVLETKCISLQGTHCISRSGIGVVIRTGDKTVFGCIAKMTNEPKTECTTLEKEVFNFVLVIFSIMVFIIILVVIVW